MPILVNIREVPEVPPADYHTVTESFAVFYRDEIFPAIMINGWRDMCFAKGHNIANGWGCHVSDEEFIARNLVRAYGAEALGQAHTCAALARVMVDKTGTGIWNRVIAILSERRVGRA